MRAFILSLGFALLFAFGNPVAAQESLVDFSEEINQVYLNSLDEGTPLTLSQINELLEDANEVHDYYDGRQKLYVFESENEYVEVIVDLMLEENVEDSSVEDSDGVSEAISDEEVDRSAQLESEVDDEDTAEEEIIESAESESQAETEVVSEKEAFESAESESVADNEDTAEEITEESVAP